MSMILEVTSLVYPTLDTPIPTLDEYRPSPAPTGSTRADDAWHLGFTLGLDREDVDAPAHFSADDARSFHVGWMAGAAEWERQLDEMFADRVANGEIREVDLYPAGATS